MKVLHMKTVKSSHIRNVVYTEFLITFSFYGETFRAKASTQSIEAHFIIGLIDLKLENAFFKHPKIEADTDDKEKRNVHHSLKAYIRAMTMS